MSKVKAGKGDIAKVSKKDAKKVAPVKEGRVTKPSQTPKAKSKEVAKSAAAKVETSSKKKSKKVPTPSPEPESDSEVESSEASDDESSASSSNSESDSESDSETEVASAKPNGVKTNGAIKAPTTADSSDDSSDADSDDSDSSEDESEAEAAPTPAKANGVKTNGAAKAAAISGSDDTSDESASSEDESEDEKPAAAKVNGAAKTNGAAVKAEDSDSSEADSDDSEAASDDSSDSSEDEAPSKKRKAEAETTPAAKKSKVEPEEEGIKNLFVGNLSWNVDEDWLSREFEQFGEVTGARVITDKATGKAKGFGYVEFATAASAKAALEAKNGAELDGRAMNVDFSTPRTNDNKSFQDRSNDRSKRFGDQKGAPASTLFIGNISFEATNDMISEYFQEYGTITRVSLPTDQETGNPKGFGYVDFTTVEEATAALEALNGADIAGRAIRLDYATPRTDNGGGGRGGGFSRGGGRGRGGFDRGGRGGGRGRGGFDRGGRGGGRGGSRGGSSYNRGGFGDFQGKKVTF